MKFKFEYICVAVPCNNILNCYPGTCSSSACDCPSGFTGPNCQTSKLLLAVVISRF